MRIDGPHYGVHLSLPHRLLEGGQLVGLRVVRGAAGRAEQRDLGMIPEGMVDGGLRVLKLSLYGFGGQLGQVPVVVGVVPKGVALADDALDELGVLFGASPYNEEGGPEAVVTQNVEDSGGGSGVRTVVEGQGDPAVKAHGLARS